MAATGKAPVLLVCGALCCGIVAISGVSWYCMYAEAQKREQALESELAAKQALIQQQDEEITRQKKLRQDERSGRIALETKLRKDKQQQQTGGFVYQVIGTVQSPFPDRRGTPRQPQLVPAATGVIKFNKKLIQYGHYAELCQFSHIWVLFQFHANTNSQTENQHAKIRPPRLHGKSVGCLSTRSPHRPNAIGLSVCEVLSVSEDGIVIRCVDMVQGTPVLDIKPYIPYDLVQSPYTLPMATDSYGQALQTTPLRVPNWIVDWDIPMRQVVIRSECIEKLQQIASDGGLQHCNDAAHAVELINQVLRQDIRGMSQRSVEAQQEEVYVCRLDSLVVRFVTNATEIDVIEIALAAADDGQLDDSV